MSNPTMPDAIAYLQTLFEERMRLKGVTLDRQVYKAGRKLPRRVRKAAAKVVEMNALVDHPKLSRMIDEKQFHKSARIVAEHLEAIDPRDAAWGRFLGLMGKISAALILVFIGIVWYLRSTGRV